MSELSNFLRGRLRIEKATPVGDDSPPWWEEGVTVEVDESMYFEYLDLLPPRYINGNLFAFGEGAGNFILFWMVARRYFAHQLSAEDTETFCRLSRVSLHA
jgi:hypothetical protein